jgi:hypothetical protein
MREDRNADRILMGKHEGNRLFRKHMHIHEVCIKWMFEVTEWSEIYLTLDRDRDDCLAV